MHLSEERLEDPRKGKYSSNGLHVHERVEGSLTFFAHRCVFTDVDADEINVLEEKAGGVTVENSSLVSKDNNTYCDPGLIVADLPSRKIRNRARPNQCGRYFGTEDEFMEEGSVEA